MRKEYILTEEEKQRKRQKIEENRIRKSSVTSDDVVTQAVLVDSTFWFDFTCLYSCEWCQNSKISLAII